MSRITRMFDQNLDMAALNSMTEAERSFTLKMGAGRIDDKAARGTMPDVLVAEDTNVPSTDPTFGDSLVVAP